MWNTVWSFLEPFLTDVLVALIIAAIGILGTELRKYLQQAQNYAKSKLSSEDYNRACAIAKGLYYVLEIEFEKLAKSGEAKRAEMITKLKTQFPNLTDTELSSINEAVCAEVKKSEIDSGLIDKTTTTTTVATTVANDQVVDKTTKVIATSTSTVTGATLDVAEVKISEPSSPQIVNPIVAPVAPIDTTKTTGVDSTPVVS